MELKEALKKPVEKLTEEIIRAAARNNPQSYYTKAAVLIVLFCESTETEWDTFLSDTAKRYIKSTFSESEKELGIANLIRLARNVALIVALIGTDKIELSKSRETARTITDNWQDYEILDSLNFAAKDVRTMLNAWYAFWYDDKQAGKTTTEYGEIINRRLVGCSAPPPPEPAPARKDIQNDLQNYFIFKFRANYSRFVEDLQKAYTEQSAKAAASILLLAYNSSKLNSSKPKSFAEWLKLWVETYKMDIPNYKPAQLSPQKYAGICYYLEH